MLPRLISGRLSNPNRTSCIAVYVANPSYVWLQQQQQHPRCRRSLSTREADPTAPPPVSTSAPFTKTNASQNKVPPRPLFPWRHSLYPPPRLTLGTPESNEAPPYALNMFGRMMTSFFFLRDGFFNVLFGRYESNLAESSAYAFAQAVAGIVSNVYRVPFQETSLQEDGWIRFRYKPTTSTPHSPPKKKTKKQLTKKNGKRNILRAKRPWLYAKHKSMNGVVHYRCPKLVRNVEKRKARSNVFQAVARRRNNHRLLPRRRRRTQRLPPVTGEGTLPNDEPTSASKIDDDEESHGPTGTFCSNIDDMVSAPLRKLYESAHANGKDQLSVLLEMEPLNGRLLSMTAFPFCSRRKAERDPAGFRKLRDFHRATGLNYDRFQDLNNELQSMLELDGKADTTIEIQVWVTCRERFLVRDKLTGALLQGQDETQVVGHLVRLECNSTVKVNAEQDGGYLLVSNWKVTDIDDLLGHKSWYHC